MRTLLLLLCLPLVACNFAGEWVDDPDNLSRAWGKRAAKGVQVVHSYYWRSSHVTREEVLFFPLAPGAPLKAGLIQANGLAPADSAAVLSAGFCRSRPSWFAPQPAHAYSAWAPPTSRRSEPPRVFLLEDRSNGTLFVYACQL